MRYRNSREVLGTVKNVTVSHKAGKWFISIQTERNVEPSVPQGTSAVGIDMGVARFATLSDGTYYAPLNSFKRHEAALRKAQQALSRKIKFSHNWKKAKARVQRIHFRIGNARRDYLHQATTTISQNHAMERFASSVAFFMVHRDLALKKEPIPWRSHSMKLSS